MKKANNNEVDLLLRSLARRRNEAPLSEAPGGLLLSEHLDADELNSFAEGVVPAAARLRYSEHLADCDSCRGIVVSLTAAAGPTVRSENLKQDRPTPWQRLAAFLSPGVLRFGVPALVLMLVVGIGFLALRSREDASLRALNEQFGSVASAGKEQPSTAPNGYSDIKPTPAGSPPASDALVARNESREAKPVEPLSRADAGGAASADATAPKEAEKAAASSGFMSPPPAYAPEPNVATPASQPPMKTETDNLDFARQQPDARADRERQRAEVARNQTSEEHGPNRAAAPGALNSSLPARRLGGPANNNRVTTNEDKKANADNAESRTVAGRRFVHNGSAWIDSAYEPEQAITNVARGSEQFRALTADEPGLRTIAQQLNGVVVVVWKNRTYRIQ